MLGNFARIKLLDAPTSLAFLPRLSEKLEREIYIKRDDLTPIAFGGNKLRKLEFLAADALQQGSDVLLTAGAIQSNHVRQTAAVAAKLGLKCMALLENPVNSNDEAYLYGGNRQLSRLFGAELILVDKLDNPEAELEKQSIYLQAQGFRPYTIVPGGSSVIGSLGYVDCAKEIAQQLKEQDVNLSSVVVASGSAGTQAGLAVGLEHWLPGIELIGVAVSRSSAEQSAKVFRLREQLDELLGIKSQQAVQVWDEYYQPGYAFPNLHGQNALQCLAELEAILLDPVYTAKAMAGLIAGVNEKRFRDEGAILFIHTGGAPALFAYPSLR